jgi:hypothetical protein
MCRSFISGIVISALWLAGVAPVTSQPVCHPKLNVTDVQYSEMTPPTLERKWTANVLVDASGCQRDASGYFDIRFTRLSETAPDLEFTERFAWLPPSVDVAVSFAANEAVQGYWLENISLCVCPQ